MTTQPEVLRPAITPTAVIPVDIETTAALAAELCHLHEVNARLFRERAINLEGGVRDTARIAALEQAGRQALEALVKCEAALAEELAAWDIDPPLHHVQEAHGLCGPAITALREWLEEKK